MRPRLAVVLVGRLASLKNVKMEPKTYQVFNEIMSFRCGGMLAKFMLNGPSHYPYEGKLFIKSKKVLSVRCIEEGNMYTKGCTYGIFDFQMRDLKRLLEWGPSKEKEFQIVSDQEKGLKIERPITHAISEGNTGKQNEPSATKPEFQSLSGLQNYKFSLKSKSIPYAFQLTEPQFGLLVQTLKQALPCLYGTQSHLELCLDQLMGKFQRGELEDEQQAEDSRFVL